MKAIILVAIAIALVLALIVTLYPSNNVLEISVSQLDNGIKIDNLGNIDCLVFINSPDGEQRFELAIDQSLVIMNISKPVEVSAVCKQTIILNRDYPEEFASLLRFDNK